MNKYKNDLWLPAGAAARSTIDDNKNPVVTSALVSVDNYWLTHRRIQVEQLIVRFIGRYRSNDKTIRALCVCSLRSSAVNLREGYLMLHVIDSFSVAATSVSKGVDDGNNYYPVHAAGNKSQWFEPELGRL